MVLELLINPQKAEKTPWAMFFFGFVYASVGAFLSLWIFGKYASLVMVFLTVLACIYLLQGILAVEEEKDIAISKERTLLKEHGKALSLFMFLFLGFMAAYSLWYVLLPSGWVQNLYGAQIETIRQVNGMGTGSAIDGTSRLGKIFFNNLKVLFFSILFAFFYGAGAVFILAWNASVVGAAIGNFVRTELATITKGIGLVAAGSYFSIYSLGLLRYMTHGLFEILAYFMAALGAGIISIAVIKHDVGSEKFTHIIIDSLDLIIISIAILFFAALVEVYITPVLF